MFRITLFILNLFTTTSTIIVSTPSSCCIKSCFTVTYIFINTIFLIKIICITTTATRSKTFRDLISKNINRISIFINIWICFNYTLNINRTTSIISSTAFTIVIIFCSSNTSFYWSTASTSCNSILSIIRAYRKLFCHLSINLRFP